MALVHVAADAEDHGDANDDEEETEDETTVHGLTPQFAGRRSASISWLSRWPSSVTMRSITARRSFTEPSRSEERRVGKECVRTVRSRWSPDPSKKTLTRQKQKKYTQRKN